ncbi:hypothetical protein FACS1894211_06770 [Clostridia bacterium]|nr:hypothetical protein FACS1894211_06770 [Clostridia bacterium]
MDDIDFSLYIPKVHFEQIPIKNLVSNQEYQRNLSASHIRRMAADFDLYQINPIKVSRRDGANNVMNGQHTIETVAFVSGSRDTPVWCMIYDGLTYIQEAHIFANQQTYTKALLPYELFSARIEAGNDDEILIKLLVESYGLTISGSKRPGTICAVSTLIFIYQSYGYQVLERTLKLGIGTWEGDISAMSATMLRGIALMVESYGDNMKDETFKEKVGALSVRYISRTAGDLRRGALGYAEIMTSEYNKKLKSTLRWSALLKKKSDIHGNKYADMQDEEGEPKDE